MKYAIYITFIIITFCSSCFARDTTKVKSGEYPLEIKHLGLEHLYDKSKWMLYCMECDAKLKFREETNIHDDITCGMLPLKFDHLEIRNDTIEIDFYFYYKSKKVDWKLVDGMPTWGTVFKRNSDSIIMYSARDEYRYFMHSCVDPTVECPFRTVNPLQPEVIKYIKENRDKLDPWFRQEAIKRGVIDE